MTSDTLNQNKKESRVRGLTNKEEEQISTWSKSRQETFILTKKYGSVEKIPQDDLIRIKELALAEVAIPLVALEPAVVEVEDTTPLTQQDFENLLELYPPKKFGYRTADLKALKDTIKD